MGRPKKEDTQQKPPADKELDNEAIESPEQIQQELPAVEEEQKEPEPKKNNKKKEPVVIEGITAISLVLKKSNSTVTNWIRLRKLPAFRIGGGWNCYEEDLVKWLNYEKKQTPLRERGGYLKDKEIQ